MRITGAPRSPYASAPVVLRKLLELAPIEVDDHAYTLDELLNSLWSSERISALIEQQHGLRIGATSITRWRKAR